jgi:hypothetical protein
MKVVFSALHLAYFRNFETVIRTLADRGHDVHLSADETETLGGRELAERLAAEYTDAAGRGRVTFSFAPSIETEPVVDSARRLRLGLDYVRALGPRYATSPKMRVRAEERTPRIVRWTTSVGETGVSATAAALKRIERLIPGSPAIEAYLRSLAPDVLLLVSLTYSRSYQWDQLKAARALRIPVGAAIMSWDHLSSKALLHIAPDLVLVWNDVQRQEAVEMHGLPPERIVTTGAHSYDHWFARRPERTREAFARAVGLRGDRPFVLYVCSALSPTPQPPEPVLVRRWVEALRASADPVLRELGVLVRPHPERVKEWTGVTLDGLDNVVLHGRNPIDAGAKADYFDSLYHSSAVIGLVTSAFLEAAVLGKPVMTFTLPEYRLHQEEMVHFQYLTTVEGGLLRKAPDFESHFEQLRAAIDEGGEATERNRRFVQTFIRPAGLDQMAAPIFADAVERLHREGTVPDPQLNASPFLRRVAVAVAERGRSGALRRLLNDEREDAADLERQDMQRVRAARQDAKDERLRIERRDRDRRIRQAAMRRRIKVVKAQWRHVRHIGALSRRGLRLVRYGAGVCVHRLLVAANLRSDMPPTGGES